MKTTKLFSLFALLFIAFSIPLWSADDDIVWLIKKEVYGSGQLLNNEKYIWLPSTEYYVIRDAVTGEEFKRFKKNTERTQGIVPYNNRMNYIHPNDVNNKLYYYEANNFTIIDSLEKENKETFGQLRKSNVDNLLYEISTEKILVWDIEQKKVVREMLFPKYEEPNLYLHEISSAVDCNNEKIIVKHVKDYRPQGPPQFWYEIEYIAFYDALTLDSLNAIKITGGSFSISSTCKYFTRIQGGIELYNYNNLSLIRSFKGAFYPVFTSDDKYLIAVDPVSTNQMQVWDIAQNKLMKTIKKGSSHLLAITEDSKFAYCGNGNDFFKLRLNLDPNSVEDENPILEDTKSYPNPTNGSLEIKYNVNKPNIFQYEITNLAGQFLIRNNLGFRNVGENIETIDVNNLPIGQYNLRLYSENEQLNFKFIRGE
jgi:hypothetical protein